MFNNKCKIALIGNMNNNNFSIMRYLRDLGVDAHLILFKDDVSKSQSHFKPECDTWDIDKWNPYIHYINAVSYQVALFYPSIWIKKKLKGYDIYIGSGYIPAVLKRIGINIDVFYPYGIGVEGVGEKAIRNGLVDKPYFKRKLYLYLRKLMINSLKTAKVCLTSELTLTKQTFNELGIPFKKLSIPMVYNNHYDTNIKTPEELLKITKKLELYDFRLFSHVSHVPLKNKIPMLKGFSEFVKLHPNCNCILVLLDYGTEKCIERSKKLIRDYKIENHVLWISKLLRKEILFLLDYIDVGFSELDGMMWGGVGWEFLSKGIPFFHYIAQNIESYEKEYGQPMPPIFNTDNADEICQQLIKLNNNLNIKKERGDELKEWFNKYGGLGLAMEWKNIIINLCNN